MILTEGTIVETGRGLFYSPHLWNSPKDAVVARPREWRRISWGEVENLPREALPRAAGEYIVVSEWVSE